MDNVIQNIKIEDIVPNNHRHYTNTELNELVASIKQLGLLEPITIRPKGEKYELVLGNKRYKAAKIAGLKTIPAIVKEIDDNKVKAYISVSNDSLILNEPILPNSNSKNIDVINLSKLNKEYERDELKMNNNQFDNNMTQANNNAEPTFGGRFFPSLEDEPTNMSFNAPTTPNIPTPQPPQQANNNFIDLTDLNIIAPPQNNVETPNQNINMAPQQNFNEQPEIVPNTNIQPQPLEPQLNNNIINIESLKQNPEMGTQPIQTPQVNIDNNFQDVINDFNPNVAQPINDFGAPQFNNNQEVIPTPINEPLMNMEMPNGLNNNINPEIQMAPVMDMTPNNGVNFNDPTIAQPTLDQVNQNMMSIPQEINAPMPSGLENNSIQNEQKDVIPVINTLKALAVNLENFGYKIRITDENLETTYKITIEVDK